MRNVLGVLFAFFAFAALPAAGQTEATCLHHAQALTSGIKVYAARGDSDRVLSTYRAVASEESACADRIAGTSRSDAAVLWYAAGKDYRSAADLMRRANMPWIPTVDTYAASTQNLRKALTNLQGDQRSWSGSIKAEITTNQDFAKDVEPRTDGVLRAPGNAQVDVYEWMDCTSKEWPNLKVRFRVPSGTRISSDSGEFCAGTPKQTISITILEGPHRGQTGMILDNQIDRSGIH
jgi:hypothetical protein